MNMGNNIAIVSIDEYCDMLHTAVEAGSMAVINVNEICLHLETVKQQIMEREEEEHGQESN